MGSNMEYGKKFYENLNINTGSAKVIIPIVQDILLDTLGTKNLAIVDFGCGTGHWLNVWKEFGAQEVLGIDMCVGGGRDTYR